MLESPSPAVLDQYLPRIREVIVHLLHGLKGKQALLREREREREAATLRGSQTWNREVPLAALNRNSTNSSTNSRIGMYSQQPQSPPLMPLSPRSGNDYDPWSGGMPRPSVPVNDLSSRIIRTNGPQSPPSHSPNLAHQQLPLPSRSTSSTRQQRMPTPPAPPPPPPPPAPTPLVDATEKVNIHQRFDESDANTASALAALKRQENLARRSSVRRASMFRGNNSEHGGGSISRGGKQQQQPSEVVPPVPTLPVAHADYNGSLNTVSEIKEVDEEAEQERQEQQQEHEHEQEQNQNQGKIKKKT